MRMTGVSGSENHLLELTAALRDHGWRSDVLIPSPDPSKLRNFAEGLGAACDDVRVVRMRFDVSPALVARLARMLSSGRYAVAHAHLIHADWHLAAASVVRRDAALVSTKHNPDPFRRLWAIRVPERLATQRYDAVIAISNSLSDFTHELTGVRPVTIHYGLPASNRRPKASARNGTTMLAVGRLERQKGFDVAINAIARLRGEHPDATLVIAGEGRERTRLSELVSQLGLESSVVFLGERSDVPELMREVDVLVHPARWEGFGLVLLEAMRAGLPIVATRVAAIPEVISDGVTGVLVQPDDPDELARVLAELLGDPARRAALGAAGHVRLRDHFSPDVMARRTAEVYDSVAS
jgi:glycosyltransferase involved in cell wall biosynthesis